VCVLQVPFTFLNFYFALASPRSACMDQAHPLPINLTRFIHLSIPLHLRPLLLAMAITEVVTLATFLLAFALHRLHLIG
jgi:hypothetical protein